MSNAVQVLIQTQRFIFWDSVKITRSIDSIDAIDLSAPFDHTAPGFKDNFRPFAYLPIVVSVDGAPLFTGTMVNVDPVVEESRKAIAVSGYATCGVLQDCTAPVESMPLEYNNLTLKEIAEALAKPFNVGVEFQGEPGPAFERVACDLDKKVFEFLTDLAKQRGFIISSNTSGGLLFLKSTNSTPVAKLDQGLAPVISVTPAFNPQDFYTDLTGLAPVEVGKTAAKKTVKTKKDAPKVKAPKPAKKYSQFSVSETFEVFRPLSFKVDDIDGADLETATKAKQARMLGNMATYDVVVATWRDANGALWSPNTTLTLRYPDAMIYDFYNFTIKSITFEKDADSETATLTLALPGSFSSEVPEVFPWEL